MIVDISVPLRSQMPTWLWSVGLTVTQRQRITAGGPANVFRLGSDIDRGIGLIGNDYLSVQHCHDGSEAHRLTLDARAILLQGLIRPPLRLAGAGGGPARAVPRRAVLAEASADHAE